MMMRQPSNGLPNAASSERGFSIIELMIALAVGLVLITGMISVFVANNQTANLNQALASLQEDARFALETIGRDVRMTGFQGCTTASEDILNVIASDAPLDDYTVGLAESSIWLSKAVSATSWLPELPWGSGFSPPTTNAAVTGTDILALQFGDPIVYSLDAAVGVSSPSVSGVIQIKASPEEVNIAEGDLAIISDCQAGDLFYVTETTPVDSIAVQLEHKKAGSRNSSGALTQIYGDTAALLRQVMVMRFNANIYYVGDTGLKNRRGDAISSLYLQTYPFDSSNPPVELVQSVEQLAVTFTQVDDEGNLRNVSVGDSTFNSAQVQAVRIGVLLASYDPITDSNDSKTYTIAGQTVVPAANAPSGATTHAGDRRLRLAFNTTIKVRNTRTRE